MGIAAGEDVIFFRVGGISAADEKLFRVGDLNGVEAEMIRDFAQSGKDAHAVAVDVGRVAKAAVPGSQGRGVIDGEEGGIGEELFQAAEFVILGIHEELGTEDLFPVGDGWAMTLTMPEEPEKSRSCSSVPRMPTGHGRG